MVRRVTGLHNRCYFRRPRNAYCHGTGWGCAKRRPMAIRLLDPATIGQIAAGEVIERPASVVKELVENALDAGARRIAVRVRGGGLAEIEVADDGTGIPAGEVATALLRHATSKLPDGGALTAIATLGFRGEGLASVAAVARTTLASRTAGAEIATAVDAFGEEIGRPYPAAGPPGTRVIVHDLFANVPARREYLRSPAAEFTRLAQWLAQMSLAYPQVGFTLEHDGRTIFAFAPDGDPAPRLRHIFGTAAGTCWRYAVRATGSRWKAGSALRATTAPTGVRNCCSSTAGCCGRRHVGGLDGGVPYLRDDRPARVRRAVPRCRPRRSRSQRSPDEERRATAVRRAGERGRARRDGRRFARGGERATRTGGLVRAASAPDGRLAPATMPPSWSGRWSRNPARRARCACWRSSTARSCSRPTAKRWSWSTSTRRTNASSTKS